MSFTWSLMGGNFVIQTLERFIVCISSENHMMIMAIEIINGTFIILTNILFDSINNPRLFRKRFIINLY
jgi:hypothetical protein